MRQDETRSRLRLPFPLVIGVCCLGGLLTGLLLVLRVLARSTGAGERGVTDRTQRCHDLLRHLWGAALGLAAIVGALAAVTALFR